MRAALAFLTALPGAMAPTGRTMRWFPVVGVVAGSLVGAGWWLAGAVWTPLAAAALAVALDLAITGMLHLDGVADSADGLLAPVERERRLEIMAQPDVGAFGMGAAAAVLLLRFAGLAALVRRPGEIAVLAALWAMSRTLMATVAASVDYARPGGLAALFRPAADRTVLWTIQGIVVLAAVPLLAAGGGRGLAGFWEAVAAVVAMAAAAIAVSALARVRLGGYTGDVLGAAGLLAETAGLLVVSARW